MSLSAKFFEMEKQRKEERKERKEKKDNYKKFAKENIKFHRRINALGLEPGLSRLNTLRMEMQRENQNSAAESVEGESAEAWKGFFKQAWKVKANEKEENVDEEKNDKNAVTMASNVANEKKQANRIAESMSKSIPKENSKSISDSISESISKERSNSISDSISESTYKSTYKKEDKKNMAEMAEMVSNERRHMAVEKQISALNLKCSKVWHENKNAKAGPREGKDSPYAQGEALYAKRQ